MERNPFEILGFSPTAFKGLTDEEIFQLVKAIHRSQMFLKHKDAGGTDAQASELNDAWSEVNLERNPASFAHWKERFVATRKDKLGKMIEQIDQAKAANGRLEGTLMRFWGCLAGESPADTLNAARPRLSRLLVINTTELIVADRFNINRFRGGQSTISKVAFDLQVRADGSFLARNAKATTFDPDTETPDVPNDWIEIRNKPVRSYFWKPEGEIKAMENLRLVGSVPVDDLRAFENYDPDNHKLSSLQLLLPPAEQQENMKKVKGGFTLEQFRPYLQFMTPEIARHSFLIAVNPSTLGYVMILGRVQAVHVL